MGSEDDSVVDIGDYVCVTGDRGVDMGKVVNRKPCINHTIPSSTLTHSCITAAYANRAE